MDWTPSPPFWSWEVIFTHSNKKLVVVVYAVNMYFLILSSYIFTVLTIFPEKYNIRCIFSILCALHFSTVPYLLAHFLVCDLSLWLLYGYCGAGV